MMIGLVQDHMEFFDQSKMLELEALVTSEEGLRQKSPKEHLSLEEVFKLRTKFGFDLNESPFSRLVRLLSCEEIKTDDYVMPRLLQLILKVLKNLVASSEVSDVPEANSGEKPDFSSKSGYSRILLKAETINEVCRTLTSAVVKPESLILLPEIISFLCLNK